MFKRSKSVLHVIFPKMPGSTQSKRHSLFLEKTYNEPRVDQIVTEVRNASARYEGPNQFVGFNLPASFVKATEPLLYSLVKKYKIKYVIAYMEDDLESKEHELRHARYFLDKTHKKRVRDSWKKLKRDRPKKYQSIVKKLTNQGYRPDVFEDEFGAYFPDLV